MKNRKMSIGKSCGTDFFPKNNPAGQGRCRERCGKAGRRGIALSRFVFIIKINFDHCIYQYDFSCPSYIVTADHKEEF